MGAIREVLTMMRQEKRARVLLLTVAQSSIGTGAAYAALLIVAYDRWRSPWAISLILFAEFAPRMLIGPLCGAAADRWPRRRCVVIADITRAIAFIGVALVGSFEASLAFALLAGTGTALFRPSMLSALPGLVRGEHLAATTSAYGAVADAGLTLGPALAAGLLVVLSPENLLIVNGVTFLVSAGILGRLDFGRAAGLGLATQSLLQETRAGVQAVIRMRSIAILLAFGAGAMLSGGIFNVIELPFAEDHLGVRGSGYSALIAIYGLGFSVGSLGGSGGGGPALLKRRFVQGLFLTACGTLTTAAAPGVGIGVMTFALGGFGNGVFITYERLIIQTEVPAELRGRAFGVDDALCSWALTAALLAGGGLTSLLDTRSLMGATAAWELALAAAAAIALRLYWTSDDSHAPTPTALDSLSAVSGHRANAILQPNLGHQDPHLVDSSTFWLGLLDDVGQRRHDRRIELSTGVS